MRPRAVVVVQVVAHRTTDQEVRFTLPLGAGLFLSLLSYLSISGASLIRSLVEVQHHWFSTFQEKIKSLAVPLEAKQAKTHRMSAKKFTSKRNPKLLGAAAVAQR